MAALTKQLNQLSSLDEGRALRLAVKAGIKPALIHAQALIPVGTQPHRLSNGLLVNYGYAKAALRTISTINGAKNIASGILGVRKLAFYALQFIELGTRKMPAQPWIRRALLEARPECEEAFKAAIARAVERAAGKT
ncbi:MAG TPA: HK97-gp10 family putative phage morphogenesis protein [Steroidobacteraceae bacterium]